MANLVNANSKLTTLVVSNDSSPFFTTNGTSNLPAAATAEFRGSPIILPRLTTAQLAQLITDNLVVAGMLAYDSTANKAVVFTGAAWEQITSV